MSPSSDNFTVNEVFIPPNIILGDSTNGANRTLSNLLFGDSSMFANPMAPVKVKEETITLTPDVEDKGKLMNITKHIRSVTTVMENGNTVVTSETDEKDVGMALDVKEEDIVAPVTTQEKEETPKRSCRSRKKKVVSSDESSLTVPPLKSKKTKYKRIKKLDGAAAIKGTGNAGKIATVKVEALDKKDTDSDPDATTLAVEEVTMRCLH